ncbi:MAG: class I SAM-dependent methyltransferase [Anaerolineaceae bacterium]
MDLYSILNRQTPPTPWAEGEKIPWNEPNFSRRMLQEHLSQDHDAASRRQTIIDRHVDWIFGALLKGRPARVLDLGCGPGFYSRRLAQHGCDCLGIDFSPASVEYARQHAEGLPVQYLEGDIVQAEYGSGYDLVMLIYGELNAFHPDHARQIIQKSVAALKPGGCLLLEVSTYDSLKQRLEPASWSTRQRGLFSDQPYLLLSEYFWDDALHIITDRYFVIDIATGAHTRITASHQAYTDDEYKAMLEKAGLGEVRFYPNLLGEAGEREEIFPITASKPA